MLSKPSQPHLLRIIVVIITFGTGFFVGDDSAQVRALRRQIEQLQPSTLPLPASDSSQAKAERISSSDFFRKGPPSEISAALATNTDPLLFVDARNRNSLSNRVTNVSARSKNEYFRLFTELGLPPETSQLLISQLTGLHHAAVAAGEPLMQLLEARASFDKQVKAALGDQKYAEYRRFEETKPAVRELERISEFAITEKGVLIDSLFHESILPLIRDSGATSITTWHGPYDPLPRPALGQSMVLEGMNTKLRTLMERYPRLIEAAENAGIHQDHVQLLRDYYETEIRRQSDAIREASRPISERTNEFEAQFEAESRRRRGAAVFPEYSESAVY